MTRNAPLATLATQWPAEVDLEAWGLAPGTIVMGGPQSTVGGAVFPRALVDNTPLELRGGMQLETYLARSQPINWTQWPVTVPEWAASLQGLNHDGTQVVMNHPMSPTGAPLMPSSNSTSPVVSTLVTPFSGTSITSVYGSPMPLQYKVFPENVSVGVTP